MSRSLWKFFTSLRLTVACLAFGLVLVFAGTLAQVDEGLWNAQARWFRSFFIWWGPAGSGLQVPVFPGGYTVGVLLLVNLVAAHAKRFTWARHKIGIQLTHLGVILLIVGQLVTDMFSNESLLSLREGQTKHYSEAARTNELVFVTPAGPGQETVVSIPEEIVKEGKEIATPQLPFTVRVVSYHPNSEVLARSSVQEAVKTITTALATLEAEFATPDGLAVQAEKALQTAGRQEVWHAALEALGEPPTGDLVAAAKAAAADPVRGERLCAELKKRFRGEMLSRFSNLPMNMPNAEARTRAAAMRLVGQRAARGEALTEESMPAPSTQGEGKDAVLFPLPENRDMDTRNLPSAVIELLAGGQSLGTWLMYTALGEQEIAVGDKKYEAALRFQRTYHDFSTTLLKTTHEVYPGTVTTENAEGIPKNFQSRVRIGNPASGEQREVDIYMNNPLRYAGLTFYQYQMGREEAAGQKGTSTFQVVRNPGWLTPYLGCILVAAGMGYQFLFHLLGFIAKRRKQAEAAAAAGAVVPVASGRGASRKKPRAAAPTGSRR